MGFASAFVVYPRVAKNEQVERVAEASAERAAAEPASQTASAQLIAPITGEVKPLSECPDDVFSSGMLDDGVMIEPTDGKLYAPCDGELTMLFDTLHAMGIKADDGAELMIHVGMDTVNLGGKGFTPHVQAGERITAGQLLMEFDMDYIRSQNLPLATPVVVTNYADYPDAVKQLGSVSHGDLLMAL